MGRINRGNIRYYSTSILFDVVDGRRLLRVAAVDRVGVLWLSNETGQDVLGSVLLHQITHFSTQQLDVIGAEENHSSSALDWPLDEDLGPGNQVQVQVIDGLVLYGLNALTAIGELQSKHPPDFGLPFGRDFLVR